MTKMVRGLQMNKVRRLLHEHILIKVAMKEGVFHIKLANNLVARYNNGKN